MINNLLCDSITRIRNGYVRGFKIVKVCKSKLICNVLETLKTLNFIDNFTIEERFINVSLRYVKNTPALEFIKPVSKPSLRVYTDKIIKSEIKGRFNKYSLFILSTNKGIMSHVDAKSKSMGGEVLLEVF